MAAIGAPSTVNTPKATNAEREGSGEQLNLFQMEDQDSQIGDMLMEFEGDGREAENAKPDRSSPKPNREGDDDEGQEEEEVDDSDDEEGLEEEEDDLDFEEDDEDEEDSEDEEEDEEDDEDKDAVIARLRKQLDEQYALKKDQREEKKEEAPVQESLKLQVSLDDVEDAMTDPEKMIGLLQTVFDQGREAILRNIPNIVASTVHRQTTVQSAVQTFYEENPKLKEHMNYVGFITNQVQDEHPDWTVEQILNEAALRSYKGLGIKVTAKQREEERQKNVRYGKGVKKEKPAFASKPRGGGRRGISKDMRSSMQKQIDELL